MPQQALANSMVTYEFLWIYLCSLEGSILFQVKKKARPSSWKKQFYCLAYCDQDQVPLSEEELDELYHAGLGSGGCSIGHKGHVPPFFLPSRTAREASCTHALSAVCIACDLCPPFTNFWIRHC